jgi:enoyl-CoA hydratase
MQYRTLLYEKGEGLGILTINRPEALNALNSQVLKEIYFLLEEIEKDDEVKVIIVTGQGDKAFAAGTDIKKMENLVCNEARDLAMLARKTIDKIEALKKPVIAAINGFALGGGCELAMACDLRIGSERAKMGQPEINLGVIPGSGGTQRLPRLVGPSIAKRLIFTGELVDAKTALEMGLVDKIVPYDQLMEETKKMATTIASKSKIALALAKSAINRGLDLDLRTGLDYEIECFAQCFATSDQKEGMRAFSEKRKPVFTDK